MTKNAPSNLGKLPEGVKKQVGILIERKILSAQLAVKKEFKMKPHPTPAVALFLKRAAMIEKETIQLNGALRCLLKGKNVKILDPLYNGQLCGSSRPKLKGKILTVWEVSYWDGRIWVYFQEHRCPIEIIGVELQ